MESLCGGSGEDGKLLSAVMTGTAEQDGFIPLLKGQLILPQ